MSPRVSLERCHSRPKASPNASITCWGGKSGAIFAAHAPTTSRCRLVGSLFIFCGSQGFAGRLLPFFCLGASDDTGSIPTSAGRANSVSPACMQFQRLKGPKVNVSNNRASATRRRKHFQAAQIACKCTNELDLVANGDKGRCDLADVEMMFVRSVASSPCHVHGR